VQKVVRVNGSPGWLGRCSLRLDTLRVTLIDAIDESGAKSPARQ